MTTRTCNKCFMPKDVSEFHYKQYRCKACRKVERKVRYWAQEKCEETEATLEVEIKHDPNGPVPQCPKCDNLFPRYDHYELMWNCWKCGKRFL